MKINQNPNFGTHNTSVRSGNIEYIVIHYVGATGDAKANLAYYNQRTTTNASADFYVGHGGDIWQYNPDPAKRYCWAVGGKKQSGYEGSLYGIAKNANCVSVEMCVKTKGSHTPNSPDWYFEQATIDAAVELTRYLMDSYNIPASRVIRHFDVNGKSCPGVVGWNAISGSETAWNDFKRRIQTTDEEKPKETPAQNPGNAAYAESRIWYRVHQETYGWLAPVHDGQTSGITGQSKQIEAVKIDCKLSDVKIKAKAHIQSKGTVDYGYITSDTVIGTIGQKLRLEALELSAEGLPEGQKLYVRYHIQGDGWSNWIEGGTMAGSAGLGKRLEGIQIKIQ